MMLDSLPRGLALLCLLVVAACGDDSEPTDLSPLPDTQTAPPLQGTWHFGERAGDVDTKQVAFGEATLTQTGDAFDGTFAYWWGGSGRTGISEGDGPITEGTLDGQAVSFTSRNCTYTGTLSEAGDAMSGSLSCPPYETTGAWVAVRE